MRLALLSGMRAMIFFALRLLSPRDLVAGVEIVLLVECREPAVVFRRVADAVNCIRLTDPRRFRRMQRFVRRIVVVQATGSSYLPSVHACFLNVTSLDGEPLRIAAEIVHESAHGYLYSHGFRNRNATREREEMFCAREALRFLEGAERNGRVASDYREMIHREFSSPEPWFNDTRQKNRAEKSMAAHGVPSWLRRIIHWLERDDSH